MRGAPRLRISETIGGIGKKQHRVGFGAVEGRSPIMPSLLGIPPIPDETVSDSKLKEKSRQVLENLDLALFGTAPLFIQTQGLPFQVKKGFSAD